MASSTMLRKLHSFEDPREAKFDFSLSRPPLVCGGCHCGHAASQDTEGRMYGRGDCTRTRTRSFASLCLVSLYVRRSDGYLLFSQNHL
jgi:hypothetical protein